MQQNVMVVLEQLEQVQMYLINGFTELGLKMIIQTMVQLLVTSELLNQKTIMDTIKILSWQHSIKSIGQQLELK